MKELEKKLGEYGLIVLCLVILGNMLVGQVMGYFPDVLPAHQLLVSFIPQILACWLAYVLLKKCAEQYGWQLVLNQNAPKLSSRESIRMLLAHLIIVLAGGFLLTLFAAFVLKICGMNNLPVQFFCKLSHNPKAGLGFWGIMLAGSLLLAPLVEEVIFRVLFTNSCQNARMPHPEFFSALVFASLHSIPQAVPSLTLLGIILQHAYWKGGLKQAFMLHCAYNACQLLFIIVG